MVGDASVSLKRKRRIGANRLIGILYPMRHRTWGQAGPHRTSNRLLWCKTATLRMLVTMSDDDFDVICRD